MSDAFLRNREFYGTISGQRRILTSDTGALTLVPSLAKHTYFIQKIHVEVTILTASELWAFQDGAGNLIVPAISAAAIGHFDFDFGPDGVACQEATAFVLAISAATGAGGVVSWEGFKKLTNPAL